MTKMIEIKTELDYMLDKSYEKGRSDAVKAVRMALNLIVEKNDVSELQLTKLEGVLNSIERLNE